MGKKHLLYVCKRILNKENDYGIKTCKYERPKLYNFLYIPASSRLDYEKYGENINRMMTAYVKYNIYKNIFHVGDKAYLYDNEMQDINIALKDKNCENANYVIEVVDEQNLYIKLVFNKIK